MLLRRVVERELLAQDRLAAPGDADDEIDGVPEQAAVEDRVEVLIAARQPIGQDVAKRLWRGRTRALVPRRSRMVETRISGSTGFRMKAAAPRCSASSALSIADTATSCALP